MRNHRKLYPIDFLDGFNLVSPAGIIKTLEAGINADRLTLEANIILGDKKKCKEISDRICDAEVLLSFIYLRRFAGIW